MSDYEDRGMALARRLFRLQMAVGTVVILTVWWKAGLVAAQAAVIGVAAAVVPPLYFARRALRRDGGATAKDILGTVYKGEVGKLALAAALFGVGVLFYGQHLKSLLFPYIVCVVSYWVGIISLISREDRA